MKKSSYLFLLFFVFLIMHCAAPNQAVNPAEYKKELVKLSNKIKANPNNAYALRDLGVLLIKAGNSIKAEPFLTKSLKLAQDDPKTLFYYGLALENNNKLKEALKIYKKYPSISVLSPYKRLMEGQYNIVSREITKQQVRQLIDTEKQLGAENLSPSVIAIFPLQYKGENEEYANIGIGIGEMIITDLSQIPGLEIVERIRLNTLMEEIALSQSGLLKEGTSPEYGKLLGAGKVVSGSYDILDNNLFKMDLALQDYINQSPPLTAKSSDALTQLFMMEKKVVLGIVASMGIELTPEQRKQILYIPTKNLQAFMAYCNGLDKQNSGQYDQAKEFFKKAVKIDPKFEAGKTQLANSESMAMFSGETGPALLASVERIENQQVLQDNMAAPEMVNKRLQTQSVNIGANFIPGQETREATEEAVTSGADVGYERLPDPPMPPANR